MSAPRSVFIYVQHLLGVGHLKRAATLARALVDAGLQVTVARGGPPVPGIAFGKAIVAQLPPATSADMTFRTLLDEAGHEIDEGWKKKRAAALLAAWRASGAQVLLIELFPFGRRQMRFELLPLLEEAAAASPRPAIVCSLRDLLGGKKTLERQEESAALAERFFDRVLVHSDPGVIRLERTFPLAPRLAAKIEYSGYVVDVPASQASSSAGTGEVVVSAGGGAVGEALLEAAVHARPLTSLKNRTWRVLAGHNLSEAAYARLTRLARDGIILERARADFTTLLANCELSVSQAGYNTLMETLAVRARAVVVPFAGVAETEQTERARCFVERGLLEMVEEDALNPQSLAAAIDRASARRRPDRIALDLNGAVKSAALIARWAQRRAS